MTTPVRGSSGPGAQMPMRWIFARLEGSRLKRDSIADRTEARPASAPFLQFMGARKCARIFPCALTIPTATFVPPTSTPITNSLSEIQEDIQKHQILIGSRYDLRARGNDRA